MRRVLIVIIVLTSVRAQAQEDFGRLKIKVGESVVIEEDGFSLQGEVTALSPSAIVVNDREVHPAPGLTIARENQHRTMKGSLIGLGACATVGLLISGHDAGAWILPSSLPCALWGALIGRSSDRYTTLYDSRDWPLVNRQLTVTPSAPAPSSVALDLSTLQLKNGEQVWITDGGVTSGGRLTHLTPTSLTVDGREFPAASIEKIEKLGDPISDGAWIGAGIGVLGLVAGGGGDQCLNRTAFECVVLPVAVFAAIGAGLDALHKERTTIFDATKKRSNRSVRFSPVFDAHRKGVLVSLTSVPRR